MSEYPELYERIDRLDKELDVQAALIESLTNRVDAALEVVLELERMSRRAPRKSKGKTGSPHPSLPERYDQDEG